MASKEVDFIIVGQGLAGSLLAYLLLKKGKSIVVFDNHHKNSSSKVAAGIINPITGRRFVKSWMFDELRAFNEPFYKSFESDFGIEIFSDRKVYRILQKTKDVNEWNSRSAIEGYEEYMKLEDNCESLKQKIHFSESVGVIRHAAQVNLPLLLQTMFEHLKNQDLIFSQEFDYKEVVIKNESVTYGNFTSKKIIFCEGQRGRFNPFFDYLPFEVSKGEILHVKIPGLKTENIIKDKLILTPLGYDQYWCGSNYEWNSKDDKPTKLIRKDFVKKLKQSLKIDFEVSDHLAAIRPTVKDRRPFLGIHPKYQQLAIFNGLGTKGASLGPYWANYFCNFLLQGTALNKEVDIKRFS